MSTAAINDSGIKPIGRGSIFLDDVFVPDNHLVGNENYGFHLVMSEFDYTRSLLGLMAVGAANHAMDMTVRHIRSRTAFRKSLAEFQGVTFPLAEHATYLEGVRLIAYRALALRQQNQPSTQEASMVKWWGPKAAVDAIQDCIVLHGHVAYSEELPLQQLMRDVSGLKIGDGTPQIQKMIIARQLLGQS